MEVELLDRYIGVERDKKKKPWASCLIRFSLTKKCQDFRVPVTNFRVPLVETLISVRSTVILELCGDECTFRIIEASLITVRFVTVEW
jgi:hypothetical protein